jgi:hypothetical protein
LRIFNNRGGGGDNWETICCSLFSILSFFCSAIPLFTYEAFLSFVEIITAKYINVNRQDECLRNGKDVLVSLGSKLKKGSILI